MSRPLLNRPRGYNDTNHDLIADSLIDESFRGEYSGDNLIYKGFARPGTEETSPFWQIAKLTYDGNGNVLTINWPQENGRASNDYKFAWSLRATYVYS